MSGTIAIGYGELALASLLLWLNAGLSLLLGLGLARRLLVAGARMVVQLLLIGLLLRFLFATASMLLTWSLVLVMIGIAAWEVHSRQDRRLAGAWGVVAGGLPLFAATVLVTLMALLVEVGPDPWHDPRYVIPLAGIILGNVMSGISLGLNNFVGGISRERAAVEAQLMLGARRFEALGPHLRAAMRGALIPMVNQMSAAGVITLPGMMTGQILAGLDPYEAVKYQILIMFLLAGATGLGVLGAIYAVAWRVTDERHRLRLDRLRAR